MESMNKRKIELLGRQTANLKTQLEALKESGYKSFSYVFIESLAYAIIKRNPRIRYIEAVRLASLIECECFDLVDSPEAQQAVDDLAEVFAEVIVTFPEILTGGYFDAEVAKSFYKQMKITLD